MSQLDPEEYIISRKRKKYRFALFANSPICFEAEQWTGDFQPDVLELGAGTGLFCRALASREPAKRFLAVDVKADRLQKGAGYALDESLGNIRFLRARADQLRGLLAPKSLNRIWITFPDPFPKTRSAKHRLTYPRFLELYADLLKEDGAIYFKTDARDLFDWSLEQLVHEGWRIEELSFDLHDADMAEQYKIQTTYEQRFVHEGLKIHFVKATPPQV